MNTNILLSTVNKLMSPHRGILAIDESINTCNKRFEKLGVPTTVDKRKEYRELLVTTPDIEQYISGYIFFDETLRQSTKEGGDFISVLQSKNIEVGIKVDTGVVDGEMCPGEKITTGLDGLALRLEEYKKFKATFAKWRAIYKIEVETPSDACLQTNASLLAEYAATCQTYDLVPIVEPEILMAGNHSLEKCFEITTKNLKIIFAELEKKKVFLPGLILKTSMVLPGSEAGTKSKPEEIADWTVKALRECVPTEVGGVVFLSGGQSAEEATLNLNAICQISNKPWPITFSYGRAIQNPALTSWAENPTDLKTAQDLLLDRARANSLATAGKYLQ